MASDDRSEEPLSKRRKVDEDHIFDRFFNEYKDYDMFMDIFYSVIKQLNNALVPAVITQSDAACQHARYGRVFHSCECIAHSDWATPFPFGAFFEKAIEIYNSLKVKEIPSEYPLKLAASKLLSYILLDEEWHEELVKMKEKTHIKAETQVMVTLAEHFFRRLSVADGYVMDRFANKNEICSCGRCCKESLIFDDTSIGNRKVWHGCLDILFDSCDVAVRVPCDEESNPGGRTSVECKKLENVTNIQARSQILAQTIVFSLVHKIRHPAAKHFLIPCMIANNKMVRIVFYDAENDILMESKKYPFIANDSINLQTAVAAWLALNHKILCSGPFEDFLKKAPKANFRKISEEALSIYETDLKLRNVIDKETVQNTEACFSDWSYLERSRSKFIWPETIIKPQKK